MPAWNYVSLDDEALLATARSDPGGFASFLPDPVILDEVQRAPALLRAIKALVDRHRKPGRFLFTGSASLLVLPQLGDSLAGRMEIVQLHPLTEAEKERRPGAFLKMLLSGPLKPGIEPERSEDPYALPARLVAGGYPEPLTRTPERARQWHRQYLRTIIERDVHEVSRIRDAAEAARLLELLALRNAELLNASNLANDLGLHRETVEHLLAVLERLFLIRRLPAWHRNEGKRLIKAPKIHLLDSGLAATLCGLQAADWIPRRDRFGHLLESFVVQQVIAQAGWTDPDLRFWHFRDKDQVEVDLVITRGRLTWGIELKASSSVTPADGHGLRRLAEHCGADFQAGVLFHTGSSTLPTPDPRIAAAPIGKLWNM
jgi:predicted AAA+ superfamily ATPase